MYAPPQKDCALCPRLVDFRHKNCASFSQFFNGPVPSFGDLNAQLLIVGLAPGLKGANRTGRPFTGDFAGTLLYESLIKFGFARGQFKADPNDGLQLVNCRIANAVRCVPPENKPTPEEQKICNDFLKKEMAAMPNLRALLVLGSIAHDAVLRIHGVKKSQFKFGHAKQHAIKPGVTLFNSYHCSRYNTQTKRLTTPMFENVVETISKSL